MINDFSIAIATVNGSGSQSANNILLRSIFRMGIPVEGKNIFPSNIAGLPTWFSIRVNDQGFTSRALQSEIFVAMNPETFARDLAKVKSGGFFLYNRHRKIDESLIPGEFLSLGVDFPKLAGEVSSSISLKKLLVNMVYVGVLSEILGVPESILESSIRTQFQGKESVFQVNKEAILRGRQFVKEERVVDKIPFRLESRNLNQDKVLMDGNTAGGLGMVSAGCTFGAWYPITPSSSLAESFEAYCQHFRKDASGENQFAMVQAEDELSAISMVAGAGWAGARAMTATSGPGVSLMAECVGLMYFAEIPGVIWDVQRMGPSTGLPTRTSQGDLIPAAFSSHGDCQHPVFLPSSPKECFEMAHQSFDLSEEVQTPVFVLSDLDLGMNLSTTEIFHAHQKPLSRGKVLDAKALSKLESYGRYNDVDGDGIPYRTLPGTAHDLAAYFTRGTGHTPTAAYSEDHDNYRELLDRLEKKWLTIAKKMPKPEVHIQDGTDQGLLFYGSTASVVPEVLSLAKKSGKVLNTCRVKGYPFTTDVLDFLRTHDKVIVLEQNKQGQMARLLCQDYPEQASKIKSVTNYDGLSLNADQTFEKIEKV